MRYNPFANLGLKAVSVAVAALFWVSVSTEDVVERGLRVPLELQNLPPTVEMVEPPPESVDLRIRGRSDALSRITTGELVAVIDLSTAAPGRRLFQLSPDRVRAPFDIQVLQTAPSVVSIRFEESATRTVPVAPNVEGEPQPGYVLSGVAADPASVEIVGPASVVRRVTSAITDPVIVAGIKATVRESVRVGVDDPGVRLRSPQNARVTITVVPGPIGQELQNVPVRLRNGGAGLSLRAVPAMVRVRVRGSKEALAGVQNDSVTAYVDAAGLGPGRYQLTVRTEPTAGFGVEHVEPDAVIVEIR
jgi:YbbR domain-containing protein